jgi:hypothetical protein
MRRQFNSAVAQPASGTGEPLASENPTTRRDEKALSRIRPRLAAGACLRRGPTSYLPPLQAIFGLDNFARRIQFTRTNLF